MPVNLQAPLPQSLHPVPGVRMGFAMAGVRKPNRRDLVVFVLDQGSSVAGVFTLNRFCAAPVQVCREHLAGSAGIRALVINTGNANAGTGADGLQRPEQQEHADDEHDRQHQRACAGGHPLVDAVRGARSGLQRPGSDV